MQETITLKREELYNQVWSIPMLQLAKKYDLSDRGLAKICKKLEIPVPSRGYWARKQNGKSVKEPVLPRLSLRGKSEYTLSSIKHEPPPKHATHLEPEVWDELSLQLKDIYVPDHLKNPHPLIDKFQKTISKKPDRKDRTPEQWNFDKGRRLGGRENLSILVSPAQMDRALCIMDTLIKFIENSGGKAFIPTDSFTTILKVKNEDFQISLIEKYSMKKLPPKDSWSKYDLQYYPNGILEFRIKEGTYSYKSWKDGKRKRLEDQIDDIIITFYDEVKRRELKRIEAENSRIREAEQSQIRWNEERRQEIEQDAIKDLEAKALNWEKAARIRAYLKDVIKQFESNQEAQESQEFQKWLKWAHEYTDRLGPSTAFSIPIVSKFEKKYP